jgi:hypothetical protein
MNTLLSTQELIEGIQILCVDVFSLLNAVEACGDNLFSRIVPTSAFTFSASISTNLKRIMKVHSAIPTRNRPNM